MEVAVAVLLERRDCCGGAFAGALRRNNRPCTAEIAEWVIEYGYGGSIIDRADAVEAVLLLGSSVAPLDTDIEASESTISAEDVDEDEDEDEVEVF